MTALRCFVVLLGALALLTLVTASTNKIKAQERCRASIKATIPGYLGSSSTVPLHQQLISCPEVRHLDLRLAPMGCSEWPARWTLPFRHGAPDVYPPLTSLRLEGYRFDEIPYEWDGPGRLLGGGPPRSTMPLQQMISIWWNTPASARNMTNLELWLQAMDWSALQSLDLVDKLTQHFVDVAWPHLMGLKQLSIQSWGQPGAADVAVAMVSLPDEVGLESLRWRGRRMTGDLEKVLGRHGIGLKRLDLGMDRPRERFAISAGEARLMRELAPGLEQVNVVMIRNGTWPIEILETLASLPRLKELELGWQLESDCALERAGMSIVASDKLPACTSDYGQPALDEVAARGLFERLERWRDMVVDGAAGAAKLEKVVFYSGDFERGWDGPLYFPDEFEGMRQRFECRRTLDAGVVCDQR
ncbi:hypothetical protein MN608_05410 [Microdochium nivale]|nr:hypothetical protein MN608_05410 [Microdochium nivale]